MARFLSETRCTPSGAPHTQAEPDTSGELPNLQLGRAAKPLRLDAGVRRWEGVVRGAVGGSWEGLLGKG
ncbi:MAG: hypothetical protein FRX49_09939 [Trebouxia sp. A1-2]|nr:MAG: hypothetical protein FRX49_09939 [Trebouxia sp. A1-2]